MDKFKRRSLFRQLKWVSFIFPLALDLFVLFAPLALNAKNPAPREKDRVWMAFTASPGVLGLVSYEIR